MLADGGVPGRELGDGQQLLKQLVGLDGAGV